MKTVEAWLTSGDYLPSILRDFHDQKSIFKWIWRRVEQRKAEDGDARLYLAGMTWTGAHVFVIDHFLWWMARHGYTLQRARPREGYASWSESIRSMKDEDAAAFRKMLEVERATRSGGT